MIKINHVDDIKRYHSMSTLICRGLKSIMQYYFASEDRRNPERQKCNREELIQKT
jgi:hypothetical protein